LIAGVAQNSRFSLVCAFNVAREARYDITGFFGKSFATVVAVLFVFHLAPWYGYATARNDGTAQATNTNGIANHTGASRLIMLSIAMKVNAMAIKNVARVISA
jgi:hypothetical protein